MMTEKMETAENGGSVDTGGRKPTEGFSEEEGVAVGAGTRGRTRSRLRVTAESH